jgi:hypothetical protein
VYTLPTSVNIGGKEFSIRNKGDYRMVLDCMSALEDVELDETEQLISCLIIFYEDINCYEDLELLPDLEVAVKEMIKFFNLGEEEKPGLKTNYKLIDYEKDEQLICSAINNVAHIEIRTVPYCHWWTFMGYYMAIGESTLSTIVGIRHKIATHQKLEKYELKFKNENPQYFTIDYRTTEDKQLSEEFLREIWNKNKK